MKSRHLFSKQEMLILWQHYIAQPFFLLCQMIDVGLIISLMAPFLSGETTEHFIIISELHFDFSVKDSAGPNSSQV